jgi:hypothetical protein
MITADLAAAANAKAPKGGPARAIWSGGKINIDEVKLLELVARAIAITMGRNLNNGIRPDGSGAMPPRKYDGKPRGLGAQIALALAPIKVGTIAWLIAAHREKAGHLARLMAGVPFSAPPLEPIRAAVKSAWRAALDLAGAEQGAKALRGGAGKVAKGMARDARKAAKASRQIYRGALADIGVGERSRFGRLLRGATRQSFARSRR